MVRVPSEPTRISVDNPSFRVRLGPSSRRALAAAGASAYGGGGLAPALVGAGVGAAAGGVGAAAGAGRRRVPVVWTGRVDDTAAGRLLQAIPRGDAGRQSVPGADATSTQLLPRIDDATQVFPPVEDDATQRLPRIDGSGTPLVRPRLPGDATQVLPRVPQYAGPYGPGAPGAYGPGDGPYDDGRGGDDTPHDLYAEPGGPDAGPGGGRDAGRTRRHGADPVRHAYYPGRRMNLGVVLLPLRIVLGLVSLYAGMGKLSDPLFFDGGEHGSMRSWLDRMDPWFVAEPLYAFGLAHPVGTGLTVAFLQIIVGVLTICGLWQRLAAAVGGLLALGLLVTVAWQTSSAYDATDALFLAAWSPLVIAGAPVYSLDARLAGEAWRTLGPRSELWELRRRVLRRGTVLATVIVGLALLIGSMLGAAVRSSTTVRVPGPDEPPVNHLPGTPLPATPGGKARGGDAGSATPSRDGSAEPGGAASSPGAGAATGTEAGPATESGSVPPEQQPAAPPASQQAPPPPSAENPPPPSDTGSGTDPGAGAGRAESGADGAGSTGGGGPSGGGPSGEGEKEKPRGLVGGLLG
ncbi:DoxX family membrane protein [Streptomyces sp. WMMC500]|uniref:DoxX family protein n=1 Tax=Streptomyces sp. WMMC500 TaxID=3015154 RepID=UPI00248C39A4|nr:DoxX family membrane protein [Streptomyces sp. WMMC500]WBB64592.1 DoxX family membrane protein [Streptomyces sp. WMMC500]